VIPPTHYPNTAFCSLSLLCRVCFSPSTTITLESVLSTFYVMCVSSQALPSHWSLFSLITMLCVYPPRHYPLTAVCSHCLLCPVCFLPGTTTTFQSVLFTMPCVIPPTHYHYSPACAVSYALCVSSQALPSHCSLFSRFTMPCLVFPEHYNYTGICAEYFLCHVCFLPGNTITLSSVLFTIPCILPPGITTTLQSVLFTMPCMIPPRPYNYSTVCPVYYALWDSSQALPLLSSLCSLLCPMRFLPGTNTTLQSVLFTMPCVIPPRHYHYSPVCAVCSALCVSSQALPSHCSLFSQFTMTSLFFPKQYHDTGICAE
jgi:hypothetical protein